MQLYMQGAHPETVHGSLPTSGRVSVMFLSGSTLYFALTKMDFLHIFPKLTLPQIIISLHLIGKLEVFSCFAADVVAFFKVMN